jgi:predicted HicB family RNase H-like nuclease
MTRIKEYRDKYSYSVTLSTEDGVHVAKCIELGIAAHGKSQIEAISEAMKAVETALEWLLEENLEFPEPIAIQSFSGKLNLRLTPEKHKEIAIRARELDVSINKYINSKL